MTEGYERVEGVELAIRDNLPAGDGRTIEGIAVPFARPVRGSTREYGGLRESFERGAFRDIVAAVDAGERVAITDAHSGDVVGYADHLRETPAHLAYRGRLFESQAARDFAERVAGRVMRVSIEFLPGEVRRTASDVIHTRVAALGAIAGSYLPAYAGTTVSVRDLEGARMTDESTTAVADPPPAIVPLPNAPELAPGIQAGRVELTHEAIAALAARAAEDYLRRQAEHGAAIVVDRYANWRRFGSLGELMAAAIVDGAERDLAGYAARALADQLTTDNNAGVTTPGVLGDVAGIVSRGRPAINAFGGPGPLPAVGMSAQWPYFDGTLSSLVGAQATQKTEVTTAKVQIKLGTEPIQTFAGGSDIAFQLIRQSSPAYLDIYGRIMLLAYAVVTDAAFCAELETGTVNIDTGAIGSLTAAQLVGFIIQASVDIETATGVPAEFVLAGDSAFLKAAQLMTPVTSQPAQASSGVVDIRSLAVNVGNLPIIHAPGVTSAKFIASNREAARWLESGPFQIQATDVARLGLNVAYWGMGAPARFIPAGIIEIFDAP